MRTTIGRMLGTLPESFFDVTVAASKTEHLAQLCSSTVMTGYLFRNVQQRLELQQQMGDLDGGLLVFLLPCSFMVACLGASEQPDSHSHCKCNTSRRDQLRYLWSCALPSGSKGGIRVLASVAAMLRPPGGCKHPPVHVSSSSAPCQALCPPGFPSLGLPRSTQCEDAIFYHPP